MKFKPFIFILSLIGIGALAGLFVLKKPDGTAWLTFNDLGLNLPTTMSVNSIDIPGKTTIYRWKDGDSWSFSGEFPEGVDPALVEITYINPDTNLIQGLRPAKDSSTEDLSGQLPDKLEPDQDFTMPVPLTIQPDQVLKLLEDARNMQGVMDDRVDEIDAATK